MGDSDGASGPPAPARAGLRGAFSRYQRLVVAMLAFLQFTIVLDFMIISPMGALLMPALGITPAQFGLVVSAYAFSAGGAGILAAGFADRFDRKRLLLLFYAGFLLGTLACGIAPTYAALLAARIVTGLFGGVIGAVVYAIMTDLFPPEMRGRVMGLVQTAFAASQILGIPAGLYASNRWGWHAPFLLIVTVGLLAGACIGRLLRPVDAHLAAPHEHSAFAHLLRTVRTPRHLHAFATTALLSTGGFMLMPFSSAYSVHNLGVDMQHLPLVYLVTGMCAMVAGPLVGRATDAFGRLQVFAAGSSLTVVMVLVYTHLGVTPLPWVMLVNALMFVGVSSRMVPSQAMMSSVPAPSSRGAFMALSASVQQFSGGMAAALAGLIVTVRADGALEHVDRLGFVVVGATVVTMGMMASIARAIARQPPPQPAA